MFRLLKKIKPVQKAKPPRYTEKRKRSKAQVLSTYVTTIFIIISVAVGMTIYLKRGLQARIEDARKFAVGQVRNFYIGCYYSGETTIPGNIPLEYEPYYLERATNVARDTNQNENYIFNGAGGGRSAFRHTYNDTTVVNTQQWTKPPICAD